MPTAAPIVDVSTQVRDAFDESCRAVFKGFKPRPCVRREARDLLLRFASQYQRLTALPRRSRRTLERRSKHPLGAIALMLTLGQTPAFAAVMQVSPGTPPAIKGDGKCSLIEAIVNANRNLRTYLDCVAGSGADTIVLPASSQQVLSGTEVLPQITSRIVIEGRQSTISRSTQTYENLTFFSVAAIGNLTLNETTVSGALEPINNRGFGVSNKGHLALNDSHLTHTYGLLNSGGVAVLQDSSVSDNNLTYVGEGGGIKNINGGTLTVTNSVISRNAAQFRGGGIYNDATSSATLTDSVVSENAISYEGNGGGIMNYGTLLLVGTTVANNTADYGGGIWNKGTAMIRRSTVSGNRLVAQYDYFNGGGIDNLGKLTLVNSTVSNNQGLAFGGGVSNLANGTLAILSSTVTGNTLAARDTYYQEKGGGIMAWSGTLTLQRSIVSGNNARNAREINAEPGVVVTTNDFNLFGHDGDAGIAGFTPGSTDIVPNKSTGGILLPLADNGGTTRTHALAMNSPALDASPDDASCPAVDQRGSPRPRGPACDIGSFEGAAVLCNGRVTTQVGTDGADDLTGTPGPDVIAGLNGDDSIGGLEGNDFICAGGGNDTAFGGAGNDMLFGQGGNDRLVGHRGTDTLDGGTGQDQCDGGADADTATACETISNVP